MAATNNVPATTGGKGTDISVKDTINSMLDKNNYRKRFNDLLGERTPQFVASLVSLVNADNNMMNVARRNPVTIIQSALKAATYDLPIDPSLGFAYIVPFGSTATFIIGYKGMLQLAMRTGSYKKINVIDIRAGELVSKNRLTEDFVFDFITDDKERDKAAIVGYCGYFQLTNGMEKTLYMSKDEIDAHEKRFRKGNGQGFGWKENYDAMARKTILRKMLSKWGIMSIDYRKVDLNNIISEEQQLIEANANTTPINVAMSELPAGNPPPAVPITQQTPAQAQAQAQTPPPAATNEAPQQGSVFGQPADEPPFTDPYDGMAF